MAINAAKVKGAAKKGVEQPQLEAGTYPCRLVQVLDMGVQTQRPFKGEAKAPIQEIMLTYEFLDEFLVDEDGNEQEDKPRWLSETIPLHNLKADLAKSTKRYKALDPELKFKGDFGQLLGMPCMVTVVINPGKGDNAGKVYTNIAGVAQMSKKQADKAPDLVNEPKLFDLDDPDLTIFKSLPEWLQEKIQGNLNYEGSALQEALEDAPEDEEEQPKANPKGKAKRAPKEAVEAEEEEAEDDDGEPW